MNDTISIDDPSENRSVLIDDALINLLLRGGFDLPHDPHCGLVVLLRGKPGTGKSTLALQLLDRVSSPNDATKYYCTLEQSQPDVEYKLASMLAATALEKSFVADYKEEVFDYQLENAWKFLESRLKDHAEAKINSVFATKPLGDKRMPLFDEPRDETTKEAKKFCQTLTEAIAVHLKPDRIMVKTATENGRMEGSVSLFGRSRPVVASEILKDAKQMADGFRKKFEDDCKKGSKRTWMVEDRSKLPIVVVDGLSLLTTQERGYVELQGMVEEIRQHFQLGILVYEPNEDESTSLDHQADLVIELTRRDLKLPVVYQIHEISFRKARYQEAALGHHQYKIRGSGIVVFPSLHFQVHHHNNMDMELKRSSLVVDSSEVQNKSVDGELKPSSPVVDSYGAQNDNGGRGSGGGNNKKGALLDLIFHPKEGESIALLGPRNSFKTELSLDFLSCGDWGCPQNPDKTEQNSDAEEGLLVSLAGIPSDDRLGLECPWGQHLAQREQDDRNCKGCRTVLVRNARAFCQRPGCITTAEFFHYVKERIRLGKQEKAGKVLSTKEIKRVVFWDLTQMDFRFPLFKEDKMLLPALMDMFKTKGLKSLFVGAGNADYTPAASAMSDHVAFCWRSSSLYLEDQDSPYNDPVKSSLMVYVDRASAASSSSGKGLYCIPVAEKDRLMMPQSNDELEKCFIDLQSPKLKVKDNPDGPYLEKIMQMQGVK